MRYFLQARQLDPDNATLMLNAGVVFARAGKLDDARQMFERAIQLNPDFVEARRQLGVILRSSADQKMLASSSKQHCRSIQIHRQPRQI